MTSQQDRPNIVFITADQMRYDTINALGFPWMRTPHLDRLVQTGVSFERCYCSAAACVPSRASLFNAVYPHSLNVYNNESPWGHSWIENFQAAGYDTVSVGKMHTVPHDERCGFDQRLIVENKDHPPRPAEPHGGFFDEWDKHLILQNITKPSRETYRATYPAYETALGAYEWSLDEDLHADVFVGRMAEWFLQQRHAARPFFMKVGFPGPHPPYDPPDRVRRLYDDADIPIPTVTEEELALQPPPHHNYRQEMIEGNHDAVRWQEHPSPDQLRRLRRYYAANVTLIDEQVGRIVQALEATGQLDNTIIVFLSDHGDCLGDHGHIQKWTMYEEVVRVPAIVWAPHLLPQGRRVDALVQHIDLGPMLFELAGLPPLETRAAQSALPVVRGDSPGRDAIFAEQGTERVLRDVSLMTMIRTRDWKLVHYLDQPWGELYDLNDDPAELRNLWHDTAYRDVRSQLTSDLLNWRIRDTLELTLW